MQDEVTDGIRGEVTEEITGEVTEKLLPEGEKPEEKKPEKKTTIEERVQAALDEFISAEGIQITAPIAIGSQCDIAKGTLDPSRVSRDILEEMVASYLTHKAIREEKKTIHEYNAYRKKSENKVKDWSRKRLVKAAYVVCDTFLRRTRPKKMLKKRKAGKKREEKPTYVIAIRAYRPQTGKKQIRALKRQLKREKMAAGFHSDNVVYHVSQKNRVTILEYVSEIPRKDLTKLTIAQCLKVGEDIAKGLIELHERGILHRDLKPENILIHRTRILKKVSAKITDLGNIVHDVSKKSDLEKTESGGLVFATPVYTSPEQIYAGLYNEQSDLYEWATTMYNLITGGVPPNAVPAKDIEEFGRTTALLNNHRKMDPRIQEKHHKPVSILRIKGSYRETERKAHNPLFRIINYVTKPRRKQKLGNILRIFIEPVLACAMHPNFSMRYYSAEQLHRDICSIRQGKMPEEAYKLVKKFSERKSKAEPKEVHEGGGLCNIKEIAVRYGLIKEEDFKELKPAYAYKKDYSIYELMKKEMKRYVRETFGKRNRGIDKNEYTRVPKPFTPFNIKRYARDIMIGVAGGAAFTAGVYLLRNCEPIKSLLNR